MDMGIGSDLLGMVMSPSVVSTPAVKSLFDKSMKNYKSQFGNYVKKRKKKKEIILEILHSYKQILYILINLDS